MKNIRCNTTFILKTILALTSTGLMVVFIFQTTAAKSNTVHSVQEPFISESTSFVTNPISKITLISEITEYEEIINRPLFHDDRKPHSYAKTKKQKNKSKLNAAKLNKKLSLIAIVITPKTRLAIMQSGKNREPQRLMSGESINEWTLANIEDRYVILKNENETKKIELDLKASKKTNNLKKTTSKKNESESYKKASEKIKQPKPVKQKASVG